MNDIFNFQPAPVVPRGSPPSVAVETLLGRLAELESILFCDPSVTASLALDELAGELEQIAGTL